MKINDAYEVEQIIKTKEIKEVKIKLCVQINRFSDFQKVRRFLGAEKLLKMLEEVQRLISHKKNINLFFIAASGCSDRLFTNIAGKYIRNSSTFNHNLQNTESAESVNNSFIWTSKEQKTLIRRFILGKLWQNC